MPESQITSTEKKNSYFSDTAKFGTSLLQWMIKDNPVSGIVSIAVVIQAGYIIFTALLTQAHLHIFGFAMGREPFMMIYTCLTSVLATWSLFKATRLWKGQAVAKSWLLFATGSFFLTLGGFVYLFEFLTIYRHSGTVPYGTTADIFWTLGLPWGLIGLIIIKASVQKPGDGIRRIKLALDTLLILSAAGSLGWYFIFYPIFQSQIARDHQFILVNDLPIIIYPTVEVALIYILLILMSRIHRSERYHSAIVAILFGSIATTISFAGYIVISFYIRDGYFNNNLVNAFFQPDATLQWASLSLFICGTILCSKVKVREQADEKKKYPQIYVPGWMKQNYFWMKAYFPSTSVVIADILIMVAAIRSDQGSISVFAIFCILTLLVASRQGLAIVENQHLYLHEKDTAVKLAEAQENLKQALRRTQLFAEEARRDASRAQHAQLINSAVIDTTRDGILLLSPEQKIILVNDSFSSLFAIDREAILNQSLDNLTLHDALSYRITTASSFIEKISTMVQESAEATIPSLKVNNPAAELAVYSAPVGGEGQTILGQLFIFRDVTHERQVERMKTEMVSLTSHELRSPLQSISGFLELALEEDEHLSESQVDYIQTAKSSSERLTALVSTLLDISSIEAGSIKLNFEQLQIMPLVEEVITSLTANAMAKRISVRLTQPDEHLQVLADRQRLYQILTNLISNAIKYTPEDGEAVISIEAEGNHVRVNVHDNGIGLTDEDREKLFTKFFRADNELTRKNRGTGLGLALTKSLVELHNGKIWVDSKPHHGSTFHFTLQAA